jgi:predicted dehydrogenase
MIKIGIIGTGGMARAHATSYNKIKGCKLVAACDVSEQRVGAFAEEFKLKQTYTDAGKLLAEAGVDAVSIVTPDAYHAPISLLALRKGKHVLCEKPLALNYADAHKMAVAAKKAGVINMVNFSYRNSSAIHQVHKLVQSGAIGTVRQVDAIYYQSWLSQGAWGDWRTNPTWLWRLSTAHGSLGVLGDVGVHLVDFATYPVGPISELQCVLKTFSKAPNDQIGEYKLDANDSAIITARFANGALGSFKTTRWATGHHNSIELAIFGDQGALKINLDESYLKYKICTVRNHKLSEWKEVTVRETPTNYQRFIASIRKNQNDQPDFARGAEVQKILDACVASDAAGHRFVKI